SEIGRRNVPHSVGVSGKLVALLESDALRIIGIIDRDGVAIILAHDRKAGHIGRAIAEVDHVRERDRPNVRFHVIVHVLRHIEQTLIDAEEELRLLGVTDNALRKSDPPLFVLSKFAAENRAYIRSEPAAFKQHLHPRRDDVMLDADALVAWYRGEEIVAERDEHVR